MRCDYDAARWTCAGYDGEGCDTPPVNFADQDWQPLGTIDVEWADGGRGWQPVGGTDPRTIADILGPEP
jgi:hypothetical protein